MEAADNCRELVSEFGAQVTCIVNFSPSVPDTGEGWSVSAIAIVISVFSCLGVLVSAFFSHKQHCMMQEQHNTMSKHLSAVNAQNSTQNEQISFLQRTEEERRTQLEDINANLMKNDQNIAQKKSMLEILIMLNSNSEWIENRKNFIQLREHKEGLQKHANRKDVNAQCVRNQLNQYELISAGINANILSSEMFKSYFRSTVVSDYVAAMGFIHSERNDPNGSQDYWIAFEKLALEYSIEGEIPGNPGVKPKRQRRKTS